MKLRRPLLLVALCARTASADPNALRVDVHCADYWADPDHGLQLTLDGHPLAATAVEGVSGTVWIRHVGPTEVWTPTDVAYDVTPGPHHVELSAPGCAPLAIDVDAAWTNPPITGRLPTADRSLMGTVGAPNGLGLAFGAYSVAHPARSDSYDLFRTRYAYQPADERGGWFSLSYEHRGLAVAWDTTIGDSSSAGTASSTDTIRTGATGPFAFTGSTVSLGQTARIGGRLRFGDVALAAGSGVGGDLYLQSMTISNPGVTTPNVEGDWYVPLWAQVTYKPTCNWGAVAMASYDVHPTATSESAPRLGLALQYQPSDACSQPAGIALR
ncbi:MAG TPA: hypothetical protein VLX92_24700 [Kofleriaceae bacterium]|nr:hypothetical protein [Kofleriaceae bacterium]